MGQMRSGMCILMVMCYLSGVDSFNVDIPTRIIHSSPQGNSWFGFSVAMYKHDNINTLLVGAPKYNTTQPGVVSGGAVLSCSIEQSNQRCAYVPFDIQSHMRNHLGYYTDNKDHQFFGATLKSKNGVVLACAPLYVWFTTSRKKREPVGTCYVARKGMTDFQEFSPCRTHESGYHRLGSCQAGFDAALTNDGERMYISAPGAFYWQGQIHSQSLIVQNEYFATGAGHLSEDDQYLGYSVATGHFTADDIQDVALGVPKGLNYTGKVVLYSYDLVWLQNITGDQLGAYFGYCLAVADYNGDGLDDIIVGAPMYTDYENREMKIEVGKVHILLQNQEHLFERQVTYLGTVHRGRFGLSVASLGDINLDGFEDFAVGAPYGGLDGQGAVFIYHGLSTNGGIVSETMKAPMQVIYSADVGGISTFGWSLAGGIDVDENSYPDLLVGAYESDKALLFKSRPIIKFLEHRLEFQSGGKPIDIKNQTCEIKRGHFFSCMDLVFCLTYNGVNVDDKIELEVEYHLDMVQNSEKRLLFVSNEQSYFRENIFYVKEIQRCRTLKTFLKPGLVDKLTPISANVSYSLVEERRFPRSLTPVLDRSRNISMSDALYIENNCGEDNVCVPDLVLTVDAPDEFIIGQAEMLNLSIHVANNREDAFETAVYISEPKGMLFNKFERRENASCSVRKVEGKSWLKCDIGNPLPMQESVFFNVLFQQSGILEEPRFEFLIRVNSTNKEEATEEDNVVVKVVEAKLHAELTLFGSSDPESITYNTSLYRVPLRNHEAHFGPSLVHKYGLLNKGPSAIKKADLMILWPTRTLTGKYLLYIVEEPITVGKIKCNRVRDINPLNLKRISAEERINILQLENIGGSHRISSAQTDIAGSETSSSGKKSSSSSSSFSSSNSTSSSGTISSSSRTESSFESSHSSSVGSSGSSVRQRTRGHSGANDAEGKRMKETSLQGATHSSRQHYEYERPSYSSTGQDTHLTSRGRTGGSYSSRSHTEGVYSSSGRSESRGPDYTSSGDRKDYDSSRTRSGANFSYSARGGSGDSYASSSGHGTKIFHSSPAYDGEAGRRVDGGYVASSRGREEGSYSYRGGYFAPTSDTIGERRRYSSQGIEEHEAPYTYSERPGSHRNSESGQVSRSESTTGYPSSSGGGRRTFSSKRDQISRSGHFENQGQNVVSSSSSDRTQRGPLLPSSGSGGHFSSTLFTVHSNDRNNDRNRVEERNKNVGSGHDIHRGYVTRGSASSERGHSSLSRGSGFDLPPVQGTGDSENHSGQDYSSSSFSRHYHYNSSGERRGIGRQYPTRDWTSDIYTATNDGGEDGKYHSSSYFENNPTGSFSSSSSFYQESSSLPSPEGSFHRRNEIDTRTKRDTDQGDEWQKMIEDCGATLCTRIRCTTEELATNEDVYVYIRSRLWVDTLNEDPKFQFPVDDVTISTRMVARAEVSAKEIPPDMDIGSNDKQVYSQNIVTPIRSVKSWEEGPSIPWWVILLATLAGILILLLIILILWKLGFFKRNRAKGSKS